MSLNCILRTQSDARLVDLARCGHDAAFDEIVRRYRGALLRHCRGILSDALAEDATQQAFVDAWAALRREGGEVRSLKPWLYRVAHHAALRQMPRGFPPQQPLDDWLGSEVGRDDTESRLATAEALNAIAGLPARQREALVMTAGGYRHDEVALALGLSDGAVRQLVCRARASLRAAASAITPWPLVVRFASTSTGGGMPELAASAGSGGAAGLALKLSAVIVVGGASVGVGHAVLHHRHVAVAEASPAVAAVARPEGSSAWPAHSPATATRARVGTVGPRGAAPPRQRRHPAGGAPAPRAGNPAAQPSAGNAGASGLPTDSAAGAPTASDVPDPTTDGGDPNAGDVNAGDPSAGDPNAGDPSLDGSAGGTDPSATGDGSDPGQIDSSGGSDPTADPGSDPSAP